MVKIQLKEEYRDIEEFRNINFKSIFSFTQSKRYSRSTQKGEIDEKYENKQILELEKEKRKDPNLNCKE